MSDGGREVESPRWANRVLERFCRPELYEEIRGDLEEVFLDRVERLHPLQARLLYGVDVLFFFRRHVLRRRPSYHHAYGPIMWKNYLLVAVRAMRRHAPYTAINVTGLAVGIACCLLILAFVMHEWSYDTFHARADVLYRVLTDMTAPDGVQTRVALSPAPLAPALAETFPEIVHAVRLMEQPAVVRRGSEVYRERLLFADAPMLEVFSFPLLRGDAHTALADLRGVVLTETTARKYFGTADPMGQTLTIHVDPDVPETYVVTGVAADPPDNSTIPFGFLLRLEPHPNMESMGTNWGSSFVYTYVQLADPTDAAGFSRRALPFVQTHYAERLAASRADGALSGAEDAWQLELQPLTAVHFDTNVRWGLAPAGNPAYAYVLAGVALLILFLACINFVTLALARSASRAREVGMRKVVGALPGQVRRQFWGEAFLLTALALVLGVALAVLALPTFNALADKHLGPEAFTGGFMPAALLGLALVVGFAAGGYPAAVLARYRPVEVLRASGTPRGRHRWSRGLVVVQFALSVALIVCTLVMARQLAFMQGRNLGYDAEQVVVLRAQGGQAEAARFRDVLRQDAERRADLLHVSSANNAFTRGWARVALPLDGEPQEVYLYWVGYDFIETMGLDLVAGRGFSRDLPADEEAAMVVNEAFQRRFGAQGRIGEVLEVQDRPLAIVGAVRDFHAFSLHQAVEPAMLILSPAYSVWNTLVKIAPNDVPATLAFLEERWNEIAPDKPFDFMFLDESVQAQYEADRRQGRIMQVAAGLAVAIACLGLFGLAALATAQRTREVGIRKVLGASTSGLVVLLTREFVAMVGLAVVLAVVPAYVAMDRWLDDFAYRIEIHGGEFLMAGLVALLIAILAVGYQSVRAALANPVRTLRHE